MDALELIALSYGGLSLLWLGLHAREIARVYSDMLKVTAEAISGTIRGMQVVIEFLSNPFKRKPVKVTPSQATVLVGNDPRYRPGVMPGAWTHSGNMGGHKHPLDQAHDDYMAGKIGLEEYEGRITPHHAREIDRLFKGLEPDVYTPLEQRRADESKAWRMPQRTTITGADGEEVEAYL